MIDVAGKTVVLTGTFRAVTRAVAEAGLASRGAKVSGSVSKKTDVVFAGDDAGSKLEKARALGVAIAGEDVLLALLTGSAPSTSVGPHPFHAAFDQLVRELEAHPRVHVSALFRGAPRALDTITPRFVERFGIAPGDDVRSFYATRDGCALIWLDREDPFFDAQKHVRFEAAVPTIAQMEDRMTDTTHAIVMPPLDRVLGDRGIDYATENVVMGGERSRYDRSFIGFDFPGDYYTPAFVVERGRIQVEIGDDHGCFGGGDIVSLDAYLDGVVKTKGSIPWRVHLFGPGERRTLPALTIDDLLPPSRAARAAIDARAAEIATATPSDPRLRALIEAIASAKSVAYEAQKDGRTLVRVERADASRQLTFLKSEEKLAIDRALAVRSGA